MIRKVERIVTETGTTIDQNVELSQKGEFVVVKSLGSLTLAIPCNIPNPETLNLYPVDSDSALALRASDGTGTWYTDFVLHWATGASLTYGSIASNVNLAEVGHRLRMDTASYSLFVATASAYATGAASNTRLASKSFWRKVDGYASNQRKYLLCTLPTIASETFQATKIRFKYEVKGY